MLPVVACACLGEPEREARFQLAGGQLAPVAGREGDLAPASAHEELRGLPDGRGTIVEALVDLVSEPIGVGLRHTLEPHRSQAAVATAAQALAQRLRLGRRLARDQLGDAQADHELDVVERSTDLRERDAAALDEQLQHCASQPAVLVVQHRGQDLVGLVREHRNDAGYQVAVVQAGELTESPAGRPARRGMGPRKNFAAATAAPDVLRYGQPGPRRRSETRGDAQVSGGPHRGRPRPDLQARPPRRQPRLDLRTAAEGPGEVLGRRLAQGEGLPPDREDGQRARADREGAAGGGGRGAVEEDAVTLDSNRIHGET